MKKQLLLKLNIVPKLGIKPAVSSRNNDLETGNLSAIIKKYRNRSSNIQKLNTKKATQLNGVPTKYIQKFSDVFAPVVTDDYNNCVDIVSFSECFKTAGVIPTYKKGGGVFTNIPYRVFDIFQLLLFLSEMEIQHNISNLYFLKSNVEIQLK